MRTLNILIRKELLNSLNSWGVYIGYLLFFFICGFYYWISDTNIFNQEHATMQPVFTIIKWCFFFMIPPLSMRSIADEKRNGTMELLLTKPIKTRQIIEGKFFSQLIIICIALVLTLPYYVTIAMLGNIDHGTVLLGYIGLICLGASYISIGILASSISRNSFSALFITFSIAICFQILFDQLGQQIGTGFWADLLMYLSLNEHFDAISRGVIDSRDIIYFISIITLSLSSSKFFICKSRF